jgi:hypothetical protein
MSSAALVDLFGSKQCSRYNYKGNNDPFATHAGYD